MTVESPFIEPALIDETLFVIVDGGLRLLASRCDACATVTFPAQASCPCCTGTAVRHIPLPDEGVLWSWTTQGFPPKPPYARSVEAFEPYDVGYVELVDHVIVESVLVGTAGVELRIGAPMRLEIWPFTRADGSVVQTFGFTPA